MLNCLIFNQEQKNCKNVFYISCCQQVQLSSTVGIQITDILVTEPFKEGSHSVDHINCSLVTPVSRQTQSDVYEWRLFWCCDDIVKMEETSDNKTFTCDFVQKEFIQAITWITDYWDVVVA